MSMPFQRAESNFTVNQLKQKRITFFNIQTSKTQIGILEPRLKKFEESVYNYYKSFGFDYQLDQMQTQDSDNHQLSQFRQQLYFEGKASEIQPFNDLSRNQDKIEMVIQLMEQIKDLKELDSSYFNFHPQSIIVVNKKPLFADFLIPSHNLMYDGELGVWYLSVMPPEYFTQKHSSKQQIVWHFGCLLFYILAQRWPFIPKEKTKNKDIVQQIRRNIILQRYIKYHDRTIQSEVFDKIFTDLSKRISLENLIEVVSIFLIQKREEKKDTMDLSQIAVSLHSESRGASKSQIKQVFGTSDINNFEEKVQSKKIEESAFQDKLEYNDDDVNEDDGIQLHQELPSFQSLKSNFDQKGVSNMKQDRSNNNVVEEISFDRLPSDLQDQNSEDDSEVESQLSAASSKLKFNEYKQKSMLDNSKLMDQSMHSKMSYNDKSMRSKQGQNNQINDSFLDSYRKSEMSFSNNKSMISQDNDPADSFYKQDSVQDFNSENLELGDQIGFIHPINENQAIGVKLVTAQFILFSFSNSKPSQQIIPYQSSLPLTNMMQSIQVKSDDSGRFIVILTDQSILVFQVLYEPKFQLEELRAFKLVADCICPAINQPSFYISSGNKIGKAQVVLDKSQKVFISKKKLLFSETDSVRATAMNCLVDEDDKDEMECYLAIGTSEFAVVLLKVFRNGQAERIFQIDEVHVNDITMILTFSDSLTFASLSMDGCVKCLSIEGELEYEFYANGQILTGCVIPHMRDYFLISSQNMETNDNEVSVYRRKKLIKNMPLKEQTNPFLDIKVQGTKIFIPTQEGNSIGRFNTSDI